MNAKEDWQIINELAEIMNNRKLFNDKDELESSLIIINLRKKNNRMKKYQIENLNLKRNFEN